MRAYITLFYKEQDTFTFVDFKEKLYSLSLKINDSKIIKLLKVLKNRRIIVQYSDHQEMSLRKADFEYNKMGIDEIDYSEINPNAKQKFVVKYVGIIVLDQLVIKCYPKYINMNVSGDYFNEQMIDNLLCEIIAVLKKYNSRAEIIDTATFGNEENECNLLSMIVFFINDYIENGLYFNEINSFEINGLGEINWQQTIDTIDAFITDTGPIYLDLVTSYEYLDMNDYILKLHYSILNFCKKTLMQTNLLNIFSFDSVENFPNFFNYLGDKEHILYMIRKEMGMQFQTRKRELLDMMYKFISNKEKINIELNISLYGSNHFYTIWEEVCKDVFNNDLDMIIDEHPVAEYINFTNLLDTLLFKNQKKYMLNDLSLSEIKRLRFKEFIKKPFFIFKDELKLDLKNSIYIPDTIKISYKENKIYFEIIDAKYRNIIVNETAIKNAPGVEEITKQYMYQLMFEDLIDSFDVEEVVISNSFYFPCDSDVMTKVGEFEIEPLGKMLSNNILAIRLPASIMFENYINDNKINSIDQLKKKLKT